MTWHATASHVDSVVDADMITNVILTDSYLTITSPQVYCECSVAYYMGSGCSTDFRAPTKSVEQSTAFWPTSSTRKSGQFIRTTHNAWLKELQSHRKRRTAIFSKFLLWNRKKQAGIFLGTIQLAYRRQKLGRSPSRARGVRGHAPPGKFWKIRCDYMHFRAFWGT